MMRLPYHDELQELAHAVMKDVPDQYENFKDALTYLESQIEMQSLWVNDNHTTHVEDRRQVFVLMHDECDVESYQFFHYSRKPKDCGELVPARTWDQLYADQNPMELHDYS
jgi:hypothetical protein